MFPHDVDPLVTLAFIGGIGMPEIMILLVIGVLLFGKRLPEVGRSLGKGLIEFKRGVQGIGDEIDSAVHSTPSTSYDDDTDDYDVAAAPKFEPPQTAPTEEPDSDTAKS